MFAVDQFDSCVAPMLRDCLHVLTSIHHEYYPKTDWGFSRF